MEPTFRDAADLRRWQPAADFEVAAHAPFFRPEEWGLCLPSGTDGLPASVRAHLRVAPEGVSLHAGCRRCGGRHETVVDFRSLEESCFGVRADPAGFEGFGLERAQYLEFVLLQQPLRAWADGHLRCAPAAEGSAPQLPAAVAEVVRLMESLAASDLRESGTAEAAVAIIPCDGAPLWLDLDGYDDAARALTAFRVREITDRARTSYTLVASEEWPGRDPCWRLALLTDTGRWSAHARIHRARDVPRGPGFMDAPAWTAAPLEETWLDGLRADRVFFPMTRRRQGQL